MFAFIDPHLLTITEEVILGQSSETTFRKYIVYMVIAFLIGTNLAQLLFLPNVQLLAWAATHI